MKTCIIVQGRMASTRLPGKVLKTILGKPLLQYQSERLKRVELANEIVVATTADNTDQPIEELCRRLFLPCFRGSMEDVLERYYKAATRHHADIVVRITGDCPLIDPSLVNQMIQYYLKRHLEYEYVSNVMTRSYPRGMDCEIFSYQLLERMHKEAKEPQDREHVTLFIRRQPHQFRVATISSSVDCSSYRLTVDTQEDFELIKKIIETLYPHNPNFSWKDCVALLKKNPYWVNLNAHVEQRDPLL